MAVAAAATVLAIGLPLVAAAPTLAWPAWSAPPLGVAGAVLLIAVGAMAAATLKDRLVLLLGAGLVGYGSMQCAVSLCGGAGRRLHTGGR